MITTILNAERMSFSVYTEASSSMSSENPQARQGIITNAVVRSTLELLLLNEGVHPILVNKIINPDLAGIHAYPDLYEEETALTEEVAGKMTRIINEKFPLKPQFEQYKQRRWDVNEDNAYSKFSAVTYKLFSGEATWELIAGFIGFAYALSMYTLKKGLRVKVAERICHWTSSYLERQQRNFFLGNTWEEFCNLEVDSRENRPEFSVIC